MKSETRVCKLVLGNGFDLYCQLNTRYPDYFNDQIKGKYAQFPKWGKKVRGCIYNLNATNDNEVYIPNIKLTDDINVWDVLFYYESGRKNRKNWCDVESFIYNFFYLKQSHGDTYFDILYERINEKKFASNDESWLNYPTLYFLTIEAPTKTKIEFATYLLTELFKFEKHFGEYVYNEFLEKLESDYKPKLNYFFNDVFTKWDIQSIDTFNYTPIETAISDYESSIVNHINGDFKAPIFGIDSSKFSSRNPGYIFTKTYRRMTADFYEGETIKCSLNSDFDDLVIFGHSLNEQDYNYYFPLFDYMNLMDVSSTKGILFYYHIYDGKKERIIKNGNVKNLIEMLNAYEKYKTDKNDEFRLVDSLSSQGRLRFRKI